MIFAVNARAIGIRGSMIAIEAQAQLIIPLIGEQTLALSPLGDDVNHFCYPDKTHKVGSGISAAVKAIPIPAKSLAIAQVMKLGKIMNRK